MPYPIETNIPPNRRSLRRVAKDDGNHDYAVRNGKGTIDLVPKSGPAALPPPVQNNN